MAADNPYFVAPGAAFPLSIQEHTGLKRQVTLRGQSLPFRKVAFPKELRATIKYFPGERVGQAQVLGPTWGPTTIEGHWADCKLDRPGNGALLINFPPIGQAGKPGSGVLGGKSFASAGVPGLLSTAQRARVLRDAFFALQDGGQLLKVEWGSIVRYGFMTSFTPTHDSEEDIFWEAEFEWIGDSPAPQRPKLKLDLGVNKLLATLLAAAQAFIDQANRYLALAYGKVAFVEQRIKKVFNIVVQIMDSLTNAVNLAFVPLNTLALLKQQFTACILAARDLLATLRAVPAAYRSLRDGNDPRETVLAEEFAAAIAYNAAQLGLEMADGKARIAELEQPDLVGVYTAGANETLRDISIKSYGTPDEWQTLADYNGIRGSVAPAGATIRVPRRAG